MIMKATSLCSLTLHSRSLRANLLCPRLSFVQHKPLDSTITTMTTTTTTTGVSFMISASKRDSYGHHHSDGKLVDENMILLRMRIHKIEMEESESRKAPLDWMEWEKKYYEESYGLDVCDAVGFLQTLLMNTRPCLALGILALLMLSMSMSMSLVVFHLVEMAKGII